MWCLIKKYMSSIENRSIVKSNKLIEAKYRLSIQQQRIVLYAISMIKPNDDEFRKYRMNILDLKDLMSLKEKKWGDIYTRFKKTLRDLNSKSIEIETPTGHIIANWIQDIQLESGSGEVEFRISELLKPYLLQLKEQFTRYHLKNIIYLKSQYSIRIYELLKQFERIGRRAFDMSELRNSLGIEETKFKKYFDFKRFVLLSSQAELKQKTDISFEFAEVKTGKKVTRIVFTIMRNIPAEIIEIEEKPKEPDLFSELDKEEDETIELLIDCGFSKEDATSIVREFDSFLTKETRDRLVKNNINKVDYIKSKVDLYKWKKKQDDNIKSDTGFLFMSLREDWSDKKFGAKKEKAIISKTKEKNTHKIKQIEAQLKELQKIYEGKKDIIYNELFEEDKSLLENVMEEVVKKSSILRIDREKSILENYKNSRIIKAFIDNYIEKEYSHKFDSVYDDYEKIQKLKKEIESITYGRTF